MATKVCRVCNENKPLIDFNINKCCKDGREDRCRSCKKKQSTVKLSCSKCGSDFCSTNKNSKFCSPACRGSLGRKYNLAEVKQKLKEKGFTLLSEEYVESHQKLKVICKCGKQTEITFKQFLKSGRCRFCYYETVKARKTNALASGLKECKRCKNILSLDAFDTHKSGKHGRNPVCKKCRIEQRTAEIECKKCGNTFVGDQRRVYCDGCYRKTYTLDDARGIFKNGGCTLLADRFVNSRTKMEYICECGEQHSIRLHDFVRGVRCNSCKSKNLSGENNPNWNSTKTDEEREVERSYPEYREWRITVYERDQYTCQCCFTKGGNGVVLNAHHLDGYNWCIEKRTDPDNGVTLCEDCHVDFHGNYGRGYNTREQYEEWILAKRKQGA